MSQKILLLTKNYPPQIGGIEKYSHDLYHTLLEGGYEVKIIVAAPRSEYLLSQSCSHLFWKILYNFSEFLRLTFFLTKCLSRGLYYVQKSDIVWSLDGSIAGVGYLLAKTNTLFRCAKSHCISRVTLHGTDVVWPNKIYQSIIPWFWRHTDEVVAVSDGIKQEAIKRGVRSEKITIHQHSLTTLTFSSPGIFDRDEFLTSHGVPTDKILLFSIGRFVELKGFHWFLSEVMPGLDHRFHYVLGGFGPMEPEYRRIIRKKNLINVSLVAAIRDPVEKARWFTVADYLIFPSRREGNPVTLLEAQYYETKSFIYPFVGSNNFIRNGIILTESSIFWVDTLSKI